MMHFTGLQVRAARALLRITAEQLAKLANVSVVTVRRAELEDGPVAMTASSAFAVQKALSDAGVIFIEAEKDIGGPGVRLRWGIDPASIRKTLSEGDSATGKTGEGLSSAPWDDDFADATPKPLPDIPPMTDAEREEMRQYYRDNPERWERISPIGKACLARTLGLNDSSSAP